MKKTDNLPMFMKPAEVEKVLGISRNTLMDGVLKGTYKKGVHFFIPSGRKFAYWDSQALINWMRTDENCDDLVENILDDILKAS